MDADIAIILLQDGVVNGAIYALLASGTTPPHIASQGVARTFQHIRLVPGMSVLENAALGANLRGGAGPVRALLRLDRAEEARLLGEARRQLVRVGLQDHAA